MCLFRKDIQRMYLQVEIPKCTVEEWLKRVLLPLQIPLRKLRIVTVSFFFLMEESRTTTRGEQWPSPVNLPMRTCSSSQAAAGRHARNGSLAIRAQRLRPHGSVVASIDSAFFARKHAPFVYGREISCLVVATLWVVNLTKRFEHCLAWTMDFYGFIGLIDSAVPTSISSSSETTMLFLAERN